MIKLDDYSFCTVEEWIQTLQKFPKNMYVVASTSFNVHEIDIKYVQVFDDMLEIGISETPIGEGDPDAFFKKHRKHFKKV